MTRARKQTPEDSQGASRHVDVVSNRRKTEKQKEYKYAKDEKAAPYKKKTQTKVSGEV